MAFSLFLSGSRFDQQGWQDDVTRIYIENLGEGTEFQLSQLAHRMRDLDSDFAGGEFWLHPKGGVRGVTVRRQDGKVEFSLPVGSSKADFGLAWELMKLGLAHGAEASDEEGAVLAGTDGEFAEITDKVTQFHWAVLAESCKEGSATLKVGGFLDLVVSGADAQLGRDGLEHLLEERMNRYCESMIANPMTLKNPHDGHGIRLYVYSQIPTLINADAQKIALSGEGMADFKMIDAGHFFSVLGDRVENLGQFKFVPPIDFQAEPSVFEALLEDSSPVPEKTNFSAEMTADDWASLAKAPCMVFLMVAGADGSIDQKEMAVFGKILGHHHKIPISIVQKVLGITQNNIQGLIEELTQSGRPPVMELMYVSALLRSGKLSEQDARNFGEFLYALGEAVASASGGFLGLGSKINKQEAEVLKTIKALVHAG